MPEDNVGVFWLAKPSRFLIIALVY